MAPTHWQAKEYFSVEEAAALLAGFKPHPNVLYTDQEADGYYSWVNTLSEALVYGSIKPLSQISITDEEGLIVSPLHFDTHYHYVTAKISKSELLSWLELKGVSDEGISKELLPPNSSQGNSLAASHSSVQSAAIIDEKPSYLLAIAALLEIITDPDSRTRYNQASIITTIMQKHPELEGLSQSNLEKLFAKANKQLKAAKSNR